MSEFEFGALYAVLSAVGHPGFYHWQLWLCMLGDRPGLKYHAARAINTGHWRYQRIPWGRKDWPDAVLFSKIGRLPKDMDYNVLDDYLAPIPIAIPEADRGRALTFNCRLWFREAIRRLHSAGEFLVCEDVDALEEELTRTAIPLEMHGVKGCVSSKYSVPVPGVP